MNYEILINQERAPSTLQQWTIKPVGADIALAYTWESVGGINYEEAKQEAEKLFKHKGPYKAGDKLYLDDKVWISHQ